MTGAIEQTQPLALQHGAPEQGKKIAVSLAETAVEKTQSLFELLQVGK